VLADGGGGGVAVHDGHLTLREEGRVSTGEVGRKGREGTHIHQDYVVLVFLDLFDALSTVVDGEDEELWGGKE
jgi:hypothetical protein